MKLGIPKWRSIFIFLLC